MGCCILSSLNIRVKFILDHHHVDLQTAWCFHLILQPCHDDLQVVTSLTPHALHEPPNVHSHQGQMQLALSCVSCARLVATAKNTLANAALPDFGSSPPAMACMLLLLPSSNHLLFCIDVAHSHAMRHPSSCTTKSCVVLLSKRIPSWLFKINRSGLNGPTQFQPKSMNIKKWFNKYEIYEWDLDSCRIYHRSSISGIVN
jgi:hypothetical protein